MSKVNMDSEQRKRITSNITFLKERLGYLDPILDRLVEKNVLTMEQRERIEKVQPPTPHKKFNEFIQFLLASPDPGTFPSFIASLEEERYFNIVERLQKDGELNLHQCKVKHLLNPQTICLSPLIVLFRIDEHIDDALKSKHALVRSTFIHMC